MNKFPSHNFASDNYSGVCPEALQAICEANCGHVVSYGDDLWTKKATDSIRNLFECDCEVFFVFNGTAANSLSLASLCRSYQSIITADTAHIATDECGAPEFFTSGSKILPIPNENGKLLPERVEKTVTRRTDVHFPKPKAISVTQATELGTVYTCDELSALHDVAEKYSLKIHMDGARFANAVAALNVSPAAVSWKCGVDVLCWGGTKNGMALGEAVIFFDKSLAGDFAFRRKQAGQLLSKMRFISAQWCGLLASDGWLKNAIHANESAILLEKELKTIPNLQILFPREANCLFVKLPEKAIQALYGKGWKFYTSVGVDAARLMCSWDTTKESIKSFVNDIREVMK